MLRSLGGGFGQSIDMLAAALGIELDPEKRTRHEMAVATAPIASPVGTLEHRARSPRSASPGRARCAASR